MAEAVGTCYARQVELVDELLNHDDAAVRRWFGAGMLEKVTLILGLSYVDEPWARTLSGHLCGPTASEQQAVARRQRYPRP